MMTQSKNKKMLNNHTRYKDKVKMDINYNDITLTSIQKKQRESVNC